MGAGGIGGFYGGRLAQDGHDVTFITRGDHLRAIQAKGLSLQGPAGDARISTAQATDDPGALAPVDVVLFCVKLFDTEDAARAVKPLLAKGGVCITLQNGVDGPQRVGGVVGDDRVMGGLAFGVCPDRIAGRNPLQLDVTFDQVRRDRRPDIGARHPFPRRMHRGGDWC